MRLWLVSILGAVLAIAAAVALMRDPPWIAGPETLPRLVAPRGELAPAEETVIALFEATKPSVVAITTASRVFDPWRQRAHEVPRGTGSGFVWDEAGHIVTNYHVIEGAAGAQIRLADGRVLPARLVGAAPSHDLAVLQVDAGGDRPAPIPLGESGTLRVGQSVLAIGNPFGLDWTLTTGIVSALDREIPGRGGATIEGLIQTDAAINPGNSGGPLIDSSGRLVGVNTAIFSPSGSSAGIGFAVPVDTVNRVVPQLIRTGTYRPPVLGVVHDERINTFARQQGLEGVLVLDVTPGSPAAAAGLRPAVQNRFGQIVPGDLLLGLGGRRVATSAELRAALDQHGAGETVELAVLREGREIRVPVTLAAPEVPG
jgi:S1-C subfamily serine protease